MSNFPLDVQMDGRFYTVEHIIYPKHGEPLAITYRRSVLGKRKVKSPSTRIRLARRALEASQKGRG